MTDTNEQQQPLKQIWWKRIGWCWDVILVFATMALAIFTALLWWDTHALVVEARKTSEQQAKDTQDSLTQTKAAIKATNRLVDIADKSNEITFNAMVVANRPG